MTYLQDRYIHPFTNFGFKRIFGTEANKALAIAFLNTLLPPHHQIQDLTYKNTENLGNLPPVNRADFIDIYGQTHNGQYLIIEIQKAKHNFFKTRDHYYTSFPIQEQIKKIEWHPKLSAIYAIGILDFSFAEHKKEQKFIHIVHPQDEQNPNFDQKLQFIYIELPKFPKTLEELANPLDQWLFVLRYLGDLEDRPSCLDQDPIFRQLLDITTLANLSQQDQDRYEGGLKYYRDLNNVINTARQEGWREGWKLGIEEVRNQKKQNIEKPLILRQLTRKLGTIPESLQAQIFTLNSEDIAALGESVFDFHTIPDLETWLRSRS